MNRSVMSTQRICRCHVYECGPSARDPSDVFLLLLKQKLYQMTTLLYTRYQCQPGKGYFLQSPAQRDGRYGDRHESRGARRNRTQTRYLAHDDV